MCQNAAEGLQSSCGCYRLVSDVQRPRICYPFRFAHLPLVKAEKVRFYAGTPIVSSRGHRLGTVCFACDQPRKFDAEGCMMLNNMGELVTRELERDWANQLQSKEITSNTQVDSTCDPVTLKRPLCCA